MPGGIYLIHEKGQLVEMTETAYDSENLLQELLEKYPNLLAGDQMDSISPRRWLLVSREMSLASEQDGVSRWSVDHLFLDQDGIPTIVEVKRRSDTRIRREVVGQMLEYASNGVVYWPIEQLRAQFGSYWDKRNQNPDQVLTDFLRNEKDADQFWQSVKTNLQAGRVRMVFVADEIPTELRRVVEFLNEQMDPAEVLAVELKQYVGQGLKTLVPRLIGQSEEAKQKKASSSGAKRQWDEASFFEEIKNRNGADVAAVARKIYNWALERKLEIWWGQGALSGSFFPMLKLGGVEHLLISVWTYGKVEIQFQPMLYRPPFDDENKRKELLRRLNEIPGIALGPDVITKRPNIFLTKLENEVAFEKFINVFDWMIGAIKAD
jgi:hypothetical protein